MSLSAELTTPNGIKYTQPTGLYINGQFVRAKSGKTFETISPTTEEVITSVQEANEEDVDIAVKAASDALPGWTALKPDQRGLILFRFADLIEKNLNTLAAIESWDNGKAYAHAKGDISSVVANFRNYAGWADKIFGDQIETDSDHFNYVRREAIGVVGMVIPWNFPLLMFAWKAAPALATGNTFVLKTAESTPLSALFAAGLAKEAGFPDGVINIISGYGATGGFLAAHDKIGKIAFTGSTATGRKILEASAKSNLKKVTLELGGKSANIVYDDADFTSAIRATIIGIFGNSGEVCSAGSRLFVQETIYEKFLQALKTEVEKLKVGDPFKDDTFYGAQTSKAQLDKILGYIEKGSSEGGRLITGGKRIEGKGFFLQPTIFADVENTHTIAVEEIFGPVLSVIKFKTVEEAIKLANENTYGLASGVHTKNLDRAIYTAHRLKAGTVWINTYNDFHPQIPFGGYGVSGIGRELGKEVLNNYLEVKSVRIAGINNGRL